MAIIREVEKPHLRDLVGLSKSKPKERVKISQEDILKGVRIVGSGKGAIAIILKYLSEKNIISNKLDEVMVADWIGYWVYNQIQPFAFPAKRFSDRTKVIFVYHQYGFPQDMDKILEFAHDKKIVVIEDCAHALASYYKGKPLGSMGDFSIYSYSKWFFCLALGGVSSKSEDFYSYADNLVANTPFGLTLGKDVSKIFSELSLFSKNRIFKKYADLLIKKSYSLYGDALKPSRLAKHLLFSKLEQEIAIRQKRYQDFIDQTSSLGICDHLDKEGVTPYVIPVCCPDSKNKKLIQALRDQNIVTGLYNFDINRNLLSPKFVPSVLIPCHRDISDQTFNKIIETVLAVNKNF